jgi:hypothetical protein
MPAQHSSKLLSRDLRLDFWRGLCMVDMVVIHLFEQRLRANDTVRSMFFDYVRFAAGGYIFMAGLCVGAIHLRKARDPEKRAGIYLGLLRRAGYVLAVHYLAEMSYLLLCPLRGERLDLLQTFKSIVLLRQGYDLLPFYVIMLALCPLLLELIRRGLWWIAAVASLGAFAIGSRNPWAIALTINHTFLPMLWQIVFIWGLLGGAMLPRFDQLTRQRKFQVAAVVWISMLLLVIVRKHWLGVFLPIAFEKVPLSLAEALRYVLCTLAIILATDLAWRKIEPTRLRDFVNRLGRRSLAMFVLHIWVIGWIVKFSMHVPYGEALAILFIVAAVAVLWTMARAMDELSAVWSRFELRPKMEFAALPALMASIALVLLALNPPLPPAPSPPVFQIDAAQVMIVRANDANNPWYRRFAPGFRWVGDVDRKF